MTIGYDIDALLEIEGSSFERIHPVYDALLTAIERDDMSPEELAFFNVQNFRNYLNVSGFARFCEPEFVPEFLDALGGFRFMKIGLLAEFCSTVEAILHSAGLTDAKARALQNETFEYSQSEILGRQFTERFSLLLDSVEVDDCLLNYLRQVSPILRRRMEADLLWTWFPNKEKGYGGKSQIVPNPRHLS
jgi:hypothetical protein